MNIYAPFLLLEFEVQLMITIRQNHEYLQIILHLKFINIFV